MYIPSNGLGNVFVLLVQDGINDPWRPRVMTESGISIWLEGKHRSGVEEPVYKVLWYDESGNAHAVQEKYQPNERKDDYVVMRGNLVGDDRVLGQLGFIIDARA